ncbi:hypothetical protein ABIF65_010514 [Bradyrhizobium japonicum]|uniref:Wadjet anti-phage system protein JetD domain-containing protein n=1 Tax=Bradyrhizobium TaxID=374 RepID=UPI000422B1BE|nr:MULTISPECIES: Wadjet anti-phage system protein JetD domain-containing protein [Bradyrhizobium]MCP1737860.1 hypothetical protein [Bradyrhizobium japonicum]MCP1776243.1 hypothetical protein [Bradyrhizobium japonicum]MCP1855645.1 hypothetical protein [Bradyrhizobium japonicum]MCP1897539.1 hypothetical protein [Bradyrhizobium japonicum]MCP1960760.1 hypothetical protein [Bradyrhizobium japonicum]
MTIENLASFNRHVAEADAARLGATLYVGGYPSLASQQALRTISAMVSEQTPIFHWSDIDPDGTWIFHTMERAVGRPILPHLGAGADQKVRTRSNSGIASLAAYLAKDGSKILEQEELDPILPTPT